MARRSDHSREELHRISIDAAKEIVSLDGLKELKARRIAERIGYTVGTLYQVFKNLDDLIEQMNAETLGELYQHCEEVDFSNDPSDSLKSLAKKFVSFSNTNSGLWDAVMTHQLPENHVRPEYYQIATAKLLGLIERAISPFFETDQTVTRLHDARVLWAGLYGIFTLESANRQNKKETTEAMVETLIDLYIAARS